MLDHKSFSALRLRSIFPHDFLRTYPWYSEVGPDSGFDIEYLGGMWEDELIDGVRFWFPECDCTRLGIVELFGSPLIQSAAVRDKADGVTGDALMPAWTANANRVLDALGLVVRFGNAEAVVHGLASGAVRRCTAADGTTYLTSFEIRAPDYYEVQAIIHAANGLIKLEIRRPEAISANMLDADDDD